MMLDQPTSIYKDLIISLMECYVVLMNERTNASDGVNEARKQL